MKLFGLTPLKRKNIKLPKAALKLKITGKLLKKLSALATKAGR